jgi:hypothetical protein
LVTDPTDFAIYDTEESKKAFVYTGNKVSVLQENTRVHVPIFELCASTVVKFPKFVKKSDMFTSCKFDEAISILAAEFAELELKCFLDLVRTAACHSKKNPRVIQVSEDLTKRDLLNIKQRVDEYDLVTSHFTMNPSEFDKLIVKEKESDFKGLNRIDPIGSREVRENGLFATLWGADIFVSKQIPKGTVYAFSEPEFLGVRPVKKEIEVVDVKQIDEHTYQIFAKESIGMAILNTNAMMIGKTPSSDKWTFGNERRKGMLTNIDDLVILVRFRLASSGQSCRRNEFGSAVYEPTELFSTADVEMSLQLALSSFNCIPYFTDITLDDKELLTHIADLLVTYACHVLLMKQSLLEKGREFSVQDHGVGFNPPNVSEFAWQISSNLFDRWNERVKSLKTDEKFLRLCEEYRTQ